MTGPEQQVKGIAQDNLGTDALEFLRRNRLDRAVRADRHEGRRIDLPAREPNPATSCCGRCCDQVKLHRLCHGWVMSGSRVAARTKHRITVTEEPVTTGDGVLIGRENRPAIGKCTNQHQQG